MTMIRTAHRGRRSVESKKCRLPPSFLSFVGGRQLILEGTYSRALLTLTPKLSPQARQMRRSIMPIKAPSADAVKRKPPTVTHTVTQTKNSPKIALRHPSKPPFCHPQTTLACYTYPIIKMCISLSARVAACPDLSGPMGVCDKVARGHR